MLLQIQLKMKKFKQIDFWTSVTLISFFFSYGFIKQDDSAFIGYFVVGGWQIISMLLHLFKKRFTHAGSKRSVYHWFVFCFSFLMITGLLINDFVIITLIILSLVTPVMAIYYTMICYDEVYVKMKRPLAQLR